MVAKLQIMYHSKFVKARLITLSLLKVVVGGGEIVYGTPSTTICYVICLLDTTVVKMVRFHRGSTFSVSCERLEV